MEEGNAIENSDVRKTIIPKHCLFQEAHRNNLR